MAEEQGKNKETGHFEFLSQSSSSSRLSTPENGALNRAPCENVRHIINVQVDVTPGKGDSIVDVEGVAKEKSSQASPNTATNDATADHASIASSLLSDCVKLEEPIPFSKPVFNQPTQYLKWHLKPTTVLVVVKVSDSDSQSSLLDICIDITIFLIEERSMTVYVEDWLYKLILDRDEKVAKKLNTINSEDSSSCANTSDGLPPCLSNLSCSKEESQGLADFIDLVVCLGGDGTLLHVSSLFQKLIPPILPFYAGSLGFLMTLSTNDYKARIDATITGNVRLTLRNRFCSVVFKMDKVLKSTSAGDCLEPGGLVPRLPNSSELSSWPQDSIMASHTVLNEVVVDRGQSPFLTHLDLFAGNRFLTTVQADGIIIASPTGSTAYSMAAGGSMVHPAVPCILVTPICPHSLSFRPIILPANMEVRIAISEGSRSRAFVSFDGRNRRELLPGECLRVMTSVFPLPTVMASDQTGDWFHSLSHCLHWNLRSLQGCERKVVKKEQSGNEVK